LLVCTTILPGQLYANAQREANSNIGTTEFVAEMGQKRRNDVYEQIKYRFNVF
jgi:hypothetical protein